MKKIISIIFIFIFSLVNPIQSEAKSYTIDRADIDIQINSDGTALVKETRTYSFNGHFENGVWNTKIGNAKLSQFVVSENNRPYKLGNSSIPGEYSVNYNGDSVEVKWKYSADDTTIPFTVSYLLEDQVRNYLDVAEFYWKFIGTGWSVPTEVVHVSVHLPGTSSEDVLKAWSHGPLDSRNSIVKNNLVEFDATKLSAGQFFEGRITFSPLAGMKKENLEMLSTIIEEEKGFIDQTIREQNKRDSDYTFSIYVLAGVGILLLLRFIYWLKIWWQYGKEKPLPEVNLSGSIHEPPSNLEPALVESLISHGFKPSPKAVTATLLNLCRKKLIKITEEKRSPVLGIFPRENEIWIEKVESPKNTTEFTEIERKILRMIYLDTATKISRSKIQEKMSSDRACKSRWESFKETCENVLMDKGYLDKEGHKQESRIGWDVFVIIMVFVLIGIFAKNSLFKGNPGTFLMVGLIIEAITFLIAVIILGSAMDKKTDLGNQEAAGWIAFKKYLKDYSVTKNSPLDSVIIWEKYIVYGAALGISLKALSQLPLSFNTSDTNNSYLYMAAMHSDGSFGIDHIGNSFNSVGSSYANYGSSGTGSSGFSSGGGGGGGGGSGGGMS